MADNNEFEAPVLEDISVAEEILAADEKSAPAMLHCLCVGM